MQRQNTSFVPTMFTFIIITQLLIMQQLFMVDARNVNGHYHETYSSQNLLFDDADSMPVDNKMPLTSIRQFVFNIPHKRAFDRLDVSNFDFNKRYLLEAQKNTVAQADVPSPLVKLFFGIHRSISELPIVRKLAEGTKQQRWAVLSKQYNELQTQYDNNKKSNSNNYRILRGVARRSRTVPKVHGFGMYGAMRLRRKRLIK
ncbi:hypothetical protein niasHT_008224 [Heterodera trifolii]|uniref:Uncharacterized protein n=1 Tax=Heterodera trifolii TaxID=157864 RepID=A0ABD2LUF8_9BILA